MWTKTHRQVVRDVVQCLAGDEELRWLHEWSGHSGHLLRELEDASARPDESRGWAKHHTTEGDERIADLLSRARRERMSGGRYDDMCDCLGAALHYIADSFLPSTSVDVGLHQDAEKILHEIMQRYHSDLTDVAREARRTKLSGVRVLVDEIRRDRSANSRGIHAAKAIYRLSAITIATVCQDTWSRQRDKRIARLQGGRGSEMAAIRSRLESKLAQLDAVERVKQHEIAEWQEEALVRWGKWHFLGSLVATGVRQWAHVRLSRLRQRSACLRTEAGQPPTKRLGN